METEPVKNSYELAVLIKNELLNDRTISSSFVGAIEDTVTPRVAQFLFCDRENDYMVTVARLGNIKPNEPRR